MTTKLIRCRAMVSRATATRRMRGRVVGAAAACVAFQFASFARADIARTDTPAPLAAPFEEQSLVTAALVADVSAITPGASFRIAVVLSMKEGWHVNWQNPGDAGLAPGVAWKLPAGFKNTIACWPHPGRFVAGPLVIFGYEGTFVLATDVTAPSSLTPGETAEFAADVSWLACSEACIPGDAVVSLRLPVAAAAQPAPEHAALIAASLRRCPVAPGPWNVEARIDDSATIIMDIQTAGTGTLAPDGVYFYPTDSGYIENGAAQRLSVLPGPEGRAAYQLRVEISRMASGVPERLRGVLVSGSEWAGTGAAALDIDVPLKRR